tara:strand:- start:621 stop:914 length:294 start_codon:yes stop_codon:yes gene_type:complete
MMKRATSIARESLVSLGVCVGKFTHSDKFKLTIGALELLAAHAKHKVRLTLATRRTWKPFTARARLRERAQSVIFGVFRALFAVVQQVLPGHPKPAP